MSAPEPDAVAALTRPRVTLRGAGVAVFWLAVLAALYALGPMYESEFFLLFLTDVAIFGLAALGLQHMVGDAGVLNLGQAAFFGLGAYAGVYTITHWGWTTLPAMGAAVVLALAGAIVMAPLLRLRGVYFAMASFAFGAMMYEAFGLLVSFTGGENGVFLIASPKVAGHTITGNKEYWFLALTTVVVCYVALAALARTGYGLSLHAVRQSEAGARSAGINVARMHVFAVCLGVIPAALAGVLYAQIHGSVQATLFNYEQSVTLITMVIVGGVLSRWGAFAGALFALYLQVYTQSIAEYRFLLYGATIVVLMVALPGGFASFAGIAVRTAKRLRTGIRT